MMNLEQQSPAAAHWSLQQYERSFVAASNPQQCERLAWVAEDESAGAAVLGFMVAYRVDADWELENIVVATTARRGGIGFVLVGELIEYVRSTHGREIFLEVRESNHNARGLYRKAGFEQAGLRRSYYSDPQEDAILCRLRLC